MKSFWVVAILCLLAANVDAGEKVKVKILNNGTDVVKTIC